MADKKLTELTQDESPTKDDLIYTVNDPGGTAASRQVTIEDILETVNDLTADTTPDYADILLTIDDPSGTPDAQKSTIQQVAAAARPAQTVIVSAETGRGDYTTLSAALAAITDAADAKEYLIIVHGEIAETAAITAKSHVNVMFLAGACVTVNSTSTLNAVNMSSITNSVWAAVDSTKPCIRRTGAVSGASYGLYITSCGDTVRLYNLYVSNETTGNASCHGIYNVSSSSPTMTNCTGTGGSGGATCYGIINSSSSSPTMTNCTGNGGSGGETCHGIINSSSSPTMTNCTGNGGSGGASCYGIYNYTSSPTMTDCTGTGGSGGETCHGVVNVSSSSPTMTNCTGTGGSGGASCYGIYNYTSSPTMTGSVNIGGGATQQPTSATIAASTRTEDTFNPGAGFPYRIVGVRVNVTAAAAAGVTLTLRDTTGGGGNALCAATAVDSTGNKYIPITGHRVIAADADVYAHLSASDATLAYTIYYEYETCYDNCNGLYHDSNTACRIDNIVAISNAESEAIYVTNNGDDLSQFNGGVARSGLNDATRPKAFICAAAWNPGQVYNMVLDGGSTNLTCAAGTANGSCTEI